MADEPRKAYSKNGVQHAGPYVWVTWLSKLLAGETRCWFAAWYKAHHRYDKTPDDPEREEFFKQWNVRHDEIVRDRAEREREAGRVVRLEEDNSFSVVGRGGDLAGKPDLTSQDDEGAVVVDGKSGRARDSDHWQVRLYLFGLPLSWLRGVPLRGEVQYQDHAERVVYEKRHERDVALALVKATRPEAPRPEPSSGECGRCDVARCPHRLASSGDGREFF